MAFGTRRKASRTLDTESPEAAKELKINASAAAETEVIADIAEAQCAKWLTENVGAFAAHSDWHEHHGHPLADIIASAGRHSWCP